MATEKQKELAEEYGSDYKITSVATATPEKIRFFKNVNFIENK